MVGAGVAGLTCARALQRAGVAVAVFDKARGVGGRSTTRRREDHASDSGAQFFTVRTPEFAAEVETWLASGAAAEWCPKTVSIDNGIATPAEAGKRRLVGVPGMSSIAAHLGAGLVVERGFCVARLQRESGGWSLLAEDGRRAGSFDAVLLSAPAPQAADLARLAAPAFASVVERAEFAPCLAVLLAFPERLPTEFDAAIVNGSPLAWAARDSSKPGRLGAESWVLHGSHAWSERHFDDSQSDVIDALRVEFEAAIGRSLPTPVSARLHRWRYALPTRPLRVGCVFDARAAIGACGDWCTEPRIEGAFTSGAALAEQVLSWVAVRERQNA